MARLGKLFSTYRVPALLVVVLLGAFASVEAKQDTTTLLTLFLRDLRAGTLGSLQAITKILVGNGTAAAPSYSSLATATKGMYFPGTNIVAFSVASSEALRIDGSSGVVIRSTWGLFLGDTPKLAISTTAPTISSGFGTSPSIVASNGTAAFTINVGTGGIATSGVIALPTATTGWACHVANLSTNTATVFLTKQTATTTTTATIGNYDAAGAAAAWVASNVLQVKCTAY